MYSLASYTVAELYCSYVVKLLIQIQYKIATVATPSQSGIMIANCDGRNTMIHSLYMKSEENNATFFYSSYNLTGFLK